MGFSLLNRRCISRVRRLMAGWKYVCSASTISLTPFSKACFRDKSVNGSMFWQGRSVVMLGGAYICQDVHPLQHPLHLPLLLGRELVKQRLQLACLCSKQTAKTTFKSELKAGTSGRSTETKFPIGAMDTRSSGRPWESGAISSVNVDSFRRGTKH